MPTRKKQRLTPYPWIKVYAPKLLHGTMAGESLEHIGIFIKLLCLANEAGYRDGRLFTPPSKPMTREYIATTLNIPLDMLSKAIEYFKAEVNQDPTSEHYGSARMQELDGGMLVITNFKDYQAVPEDVKSKKEKIPLSPEGKEKRDGFLAERGAYTHPEDAKRGLTSRAFEDAIKKSNKRLDKVAQSSEVVATTEGGEQ